MEIAVIGESELCLLDSFKRKEWTEADKEHYGDESPDYSKHGFTLVAKEGEDIIGYLYFTVELGVAYIDSMIVGKAHRKQGVATQLMNEAEVIAKSQGAHKAWLVTGDDWGARTLYESLGYELRSTLPYYYRKRDFVILDKDL